MIKFSAITAKAKTAVTTNSALLSWCQDNFGRAPKVYIGLDASNPPAEADCPFIAFVSPSRTGGMEASEQTFDLIVTFGLVSETVTADSNGNQTIAGTDLIGDFWELIWAALVAGFGSANAYLSQEDTTIDGVVTFPLFVGASQITLTVPVTMGVDITL
jgi:hypothetical protein